MQIPDNYIIQLRFKIDNHAPKNYMNRWCKLKDKCESGQNENEEIVKNWLSQCKLDTNKNMSFLNRFEGGIGGNNNQINKQIRFRNNFLHKYTDLKYKDNDIILLEIVSTVYEKWNFDELDDLIYGFIKMANNYVKEKCVLGYIEMINKDLYFNDDYLDSGNDD